MAMECQSLQRMGQASASRAHQECLLTGGGLSGCGEDVYLVFAIAITSRWSPCHFVVILGVCSSCERWFGRSSQVVEFVVISRLLISKQRNGTKDSLRAQP